MNKWSLLAVKLIIDLVRYLCLLAGTAGFLVGLAGLVGYGGSFENSLSFLVGGLFLILVALIVTYFALGRSKKRTLLVILDDLFISLLPPW